jgi:hypothetical protein
MYSPKYTHNEQQQNYQQTKEISGVVPAPDKKVSIESYHNKQPA